MLSSADYERLIAVKRCEIQREKTALGLTVPASETTTENIENGIEIRDEESRKKVVKFSQNNPVVNNEEIHDGAETPPDGELSYEIPAELNRYIRRYIGLPIMLKAGEFSPNNPALRADLTRDADSFLGFGEYERRSREGRRRRQQQYREFLDQQAKLKQDEKERLERERKEQETRELEREKRLLERNTSPRERDRHTERRVLERDKVSKVDTAVQVNSRWSEPLSVGVQTEDSEFYNLPAKRHSLKSQLTEAERELSPRTVIDTRDSSHDTRRDSSRDRRSSHGDVDEQNRIELRPKRSLCEPPRVTSLLDADVIHLRNVQAEQDAMERRQYYRQELKNQIEEQQRIREERRAREKMLEQAEMRRLEEQLKMLKAAQEYENTRNDQITMKLRENKLDYDNKRISIQREIDIEKHSLFKPVPPKRSIYTSKSESSNVNTQKTSNNHFGNKIPYSTNIPEHSIFSSTYDVDHYLRKNLNPSKESMFSLRLDSGYSKSEGDTVKNYDSRLNTSKTQETSNSVNKDRRYSFAPDYEIQNCNKIVEKALVHEIPSRYAENKMAEASHKMADKSLKSMRKIDSPLENRNINLDLSVNKSGYEPSFLKNNSRISEEIPIPVLRHSPLVNSVKESVTNGAKSSEAMKLVEDKWKVPAVQRNILKSLPNPEGKNVSILTQLGSIRRQLQMEQLKLDKMLSPDNDV